MEPFNKNVKVSRADSGTKNTNVIAILYRMQDLYTSKILLTKKAIDYFSQ